MNEEKHNHLVPVKFLQKIEALSSLSIHEAAKSATNLSQWASQLILDGPLCNCDSNVYLETTHRTVIWCDNCQRDSEPDWLTGFCFRCGMAFAHPLNVVEEKSKSKTIPPLSNLDAKGQPTTLAAEGNHE